MTVKMAGGATLTKENSYEKFSLVKLFGEVPTGNDKIRVAVISTPRGDRLDIRRYYFNIVDGEWLPTRKGLSLDGEQLCQVFDLLSKAIDGLTNKDS